MRLLELSPQLVMPRRAERSGSGETVAIGDILQGLLTGGAQ